jgi:ATP-dependent HslUV protease ATP-binding subunit HslU
MVIYLAGEVDEEARLDEMSPRQIVSELDKHVVGQRNAKRAVAVALRNRVRRQKLAPEMAVDVMPKNIIMIGSTGIGKTEIARRLARMSNSPFLKVEASKFTEVGYVGRDVESMIRDLTEISIEITRQEKSEEVAEKAELNVEERILDLLLPPLRSNAGYFDFDSETSEEETTEEADSPAKDEQFQRTREKLRTQLRSGKLDNRLIELEVREKNFPVIELAGPQGVEEMGINMKDMLGNLFQGRTKRRKMRVDEAIEYMMQEEEERLIDMDQVARAAIERVENSGIIFLDEIDKIAGRESGHGPDVSREGVQRDILPIVEGTTVNSRYGMVRTDHILFIAAGAFHVSKPSDLIPELQGRFPFGSSLSHSRSKTSNEFLRNQETRSLSNTRQ